MKNGIDGLIEGKMKSGKSQNAKVDEIKMFELTADHDHKEDDDHSKLPKAYKVMLVTSERSRDESISYRDVRHILFTKETYKNDDKAQEVYDKWVADGAKGEDFVELAKPRVSMIIRKQETITTHL